MRVSKHTSLVVAEIVVLLVAYSTPYSQGRKRIYVSPSGDDTHSGLSREEALRTIAAALAMVEPSDEIRLLPGTYFGKTIIENVHGEPEAPVTIMSDASEPAAFAVIDGGSEPGSNLRNRGFEIYSSSWITLRNLKFRNCWTDVIVMQNASYISVIGCDFRGGRRVILPRGPECHHFLVENCYWEQDEGVWTTYDWDEMHHGSLSYFNGALFHPRRTSGSYVMRGNTIVNVFNGFRTRPEAYNQDGNGEVYDNAFINVADNAFEPEQWAWNIHFYHNTLHNIHKAFSIDDVKGGPLYIYGNVETEDTDPNAIDKVSGIWKFKDGPLTLPCYAFNNSFYTEARAFKSGEATNQQMKHFNNAYYFFAGTDRFTLTDWHDSFEFDYDCSNQPWPTNIIVHNQEQHGIVADPMFVDGPGGDLRLRPESPCIDAGKVMSFPEFEWTQSYVGRAPDIGAFEGDRLVQGPPFRHRTPPGGLPYVEKPRIVRHEIRRDTLKLYFSAELDSTTVRSEAVHVYRDELEVLLQNVTVGATNYELLVVSTEWLEDEPISIYLDPLPRGVNGETATHWASTIPVADRDRVLSVADGTLPVDQPALAVRVYPNPVNATAIIKVTHAKTGMEIGAAAAPLGIYNVTGRLVTTLSPTVVGRDLSYTLSATELASGVYFAVFRQGDREAVCKFSILK